MYTISNDPHLQEHCPNHNPNPNPNPNPSPNFDQVVHFIHHDQLLYFKDVSDYLMLDESLEERDLLIPNKSSTISTNHDDESSSSALVASYNIKSCRRIVKKYNKEKQEFRVAFRTKSDVEIMDDGFKWRKYGKKMVKSNPNPRNYFKCSNGGCSVKKRVEREREDSSYVITTYEGLHNHHSPTFVLYSTPHSISL